jgi:hypothetical protein
MNPADRNANANANIKAAQQRVVLVHTNARFHGDEPVHGARLDQRLGLWGAPLCSNTRVVRDADARLGRVQRSCELGDPRECHVVLPRLGWALVAVDSAALKIEVVPGETIPAETQLMSWSCPVDDSKEAWEA